MPVISAGGKNRLGQQHWFYPYWVWKAVCERKEEKERKWNHGVCGQGIWRKRGALGKVLRGPAGLNLQFYPIRFWNLTPTFFISKCSWCHLPNFTEWLVREQTLWNVVLLSFTNEDLSSQCGSKACESTVCMPRSLTPCDPRHWVQ